MLRRASPLVLALIFPWLSACHKKPKVEFPRPPASASIPEEPPPRPAPEEVEAPPSDPQPTPAESPPVANQRPRSPRRAPAPPPPEPAPPVQPPPAPSPRLAPGKDDPATIQDKIRRTETLLSSVRERVLTAQQREQAEAAGGFVAQAKDAMGEGEWRRAAVLADKAFILAEDVERGSRD